MKQHVTSIPALLLALALLLSSGAFAATGEATVTNILRAGDGAGRGAAVVSVTDETMRREIDVKTVDETLVPGRVTVSYDEVSAKPGEHVYVRVSFSPDREVRGGTLVNYIYFDTAFFRLATDADGTNGYDGAVDDGFSSGPFDFYPSGQTIAQLPGGDASLLDDEKNMKEYLMVLYSAPGAVYSAGEEYWVGTLDLVVREDTTKTDGWVRNEQPFYYRLGNSSQVPRVGPDYRDGDRASHALAYHDLHVVRPVTVVYDWGTDAPSDQALPVDTNTYASEALARAAKDAGYTFSTSVPGTRNGKDGRWRFSGWDSGTPDGAAGALVFRGSWTFETDGSPERTYTVTWKSQDGGAVYETDRAVARGTQPSYDGAAPTRAADQSYAYTFAGWSTNRGAESGTAAAELPAVTSDRTYYAAFGRTATPAGGYSVTVAPSDGGSVTVAPATRAAAGTTVTLTPKANKLRELASLTVTGPGGADIPIERKSDGTYAFTMPAGGVTVRASFAGRLATPEETGASELLNTDEHIWYLRGYVDGSIRPLGNMTRAEAAQAFYRLLRRPEVELTKAFPDVPEGTWCTQAVRTLASMGVINGGSDGNFWPDRLITRAEFAAIATRFAKATGGATTFGDVPEDHWAHDNIATASDYGWIKGYGGGRFGPENLVTRAEVATIINHMLGRAADRSYVAAHRDALNRFSDLQDTAQWYYLDMVEASNAHQYDRSGGQEAWTQLVKDELKD